MGNNPNRNQGASEAFEGVAPGARVQLTYRPRISDEEVELPLRMLVLGDFTQRPAPRPISERRPIAIDKETFAEVMQASRLELRFTVTDTLDGDPRGRDVHLRFRRLQDMEPEAVLSQVPALKALLELRQSLTALKGPLGGEKAFRNRIVALMSDPRSRRRLAEEIGVPMAPPRALSPEAAAVLDQVRNAASADLLGHLAEHPEVAVRAAIAENPETPARTLLELSKSFPVEVANNPVFPLLAFEIPDWLSRTSGLCLKEILRIGNIAAPEVLLAQMAASTAWQAREAAAEDPRTPLASLLALSKDSAWNITTLLLRNPSFPFETWSEWVKKNPDLIAKGARNPNAPAEWLREHAQSTGYGVREAIAEHPHLPADLQVLLGHDDDRCVRARIARRTDLPEDLLLLLATDPDPYVRSQIAANPRTPAHLLPTFAEDCDSARNGLLGNRNAPAELLERVREKNREAWRASTASTVIPLGDPQGARP